MGFNNPALLGATEEYLREKYLRERIDNMKTLEIILEGYLRSLGRFGSENEGYYYIGETTLIEELLFKMGYSVDDVYDLTDKDDV